MVIKNTMVDVSKINEEFDVMRE